MADPWGAFERVEPQQRQGGDWSAFEEVRPGAGDALRATAQGAVGGLQEGGMAAMGATAGAMAGAPLGPGGVALGGALGGTAGFIGGRIMRQQTVGGLEDVDQRVRGWGAFGETLGAGVPFAALPIAIGKMGGRLPQSMIGNWLNKVLDTAAQHPGRFLAVEAPSLLSAAAAGGAVESYFPGSSGTRAVAEITAGILNPARMAMMGVRYGVHQLQRLWGGISPSAARTNAGQALRELVEAAGEDPEMLARMMRDTGIPGVEINVAQRTGSPALAALQAKLAKDNAKFGAEVQKQAEEGMQALEGMIVALRGTGDPQALRLAAHLRDRQFQMMLSGRIKSVEAEAVAAASRITSDTPAARSALSVQARDALDTVLSESRAVERELWGKLPREAPVTTTNMEGAYQKLLDDLLPNEDLPSVLSGYMRLLTRRGASDATTPDEVAALMAQLYGGDPEIVGRPLRKDLGELLRFRSRALGLAREADAGGRYGEARMFGKMAEAALEDMNSISAAGLDPIAIDEARAFSRALHESFTRTFAGTGMSSARTGGERVPAELLMRRALAGGEEAAALHFRELDDATRFLSRQGMDTPKTIEAIELMQEAQERIMRLTAAEAIDPTTGRASIPRLERLLSREEALFNRFPEVRNTVRQAIKSEADAQRFAETVKDAQRAVSQSAAFAKVAKVENPVDAISAAVRGSAPIRDLKAMAKLAQSGGPNAVEGMRAAAIDHAMRHGGDTFDPKAIRAALFSPVRPGRPSLADTLKNSGAIDQGSLDRITQYLDQADRILSTQQVRPDLAEASEQISALTDLLLRIQGARLGSLIGQAGPVEGHGLIAAAAGSRYMRQVFNKMNIDTTRNVLLEAFRDPSGELMALLLETPRSEAQAFQLGRQIHAYLLSAGFRFAGTSVMDAMEGEEAQPSPWQMPPQQQPAEEPDMGGVPAPRQEDDDE